MLKLRLLLSFLLLIISFTLFSQKGKNGAGIISAANTRVNEFTSLTANANAGNTTLTVASSLLNTNSRFTSTLTPGDLIMVIQMQGALIKVKPYNSWEAYVTDSLYGQIYSYETCGNYEFAEVKSIISSTQIELNCGLQYNYSFSGKTQIVRVPRYNSLTVNSGGVLTTDAWNGTIGGVLATEVDGNTIVNTGGSISATGTGFRGGAPVASGGNNFYPFSMASGTNNGSEKGEGIGSDRLNNTFDSLGRFCKGAPGNAGGGGNANNCGGGGGANGGNISAYNGYGVASAGFTAIWNLEWPGRATVVSSGGGKGGYGTSTTTTANINTVGPNSTSWGSFKRMSAGGFGGRPLDYSSGKIFMGGGGGAGHTSAGQSNGANACRGGNGGGIVFLLNYGTISGPGVIESNGSNGFNAFGTGNFSNPTQGIDGAGGAGGGGTIILKSNGAISGITANANGGNGGNQVKSGTASSEGQGPGGGGGGGYIAGNGSVFTQNVNGGSNGTTNATAFDTEFPMNGATSGNVGNNNQLIAPSFSLTSSPNQTLCTGQSASLTATSNNSTATILWYNNPSGGNSIATGTVYTTPTYTANGTYTVYAGSCPGLYRIPIVLTVTNGATITVNSATICAGQSVVLTANGASTYTWNTGANTNSISVSPTALTVYTVNGTSGSCNGVNTSTVNVNNTPTVNVANSSVCSGNSATLTATGATNYTWMPGGQTTTSIVVSPTINTTYTITGANGTCSNTTTANVSISSTPTLSVNSNTICAGQIATFTVSGATNYTWTPGNVTGSTYTTSPSSSGTISVIGANGSCTAQVTTSITVIPNPTVSVSNQTICAGQTATVTASGATTYSWNTGSTSSSITVSPSSLTIYTVTGTTNGCTNTRTVSVNVSAQPTLTALSATSCSSQTATLTVSGASSYTWNPGGQTSATITTNPGSTTVYTIQGATGTCTATTTTTLTIINTPTLSLSSVTICPSQTATLTVSGATNYTWSPGNSNGSSYTIAPASNTVVSVIGANGTCTSSASASVTIGSGISISVNSATICAGETATLTASGATSYSWNTGATSNSITASPSNTTTYTVSGTSGACSGSNTAVVTVVSAPILSITNASICSGNTATLTASGANTYSWIPGGQTTASITDNPSSTNTYTVIGAIGTCTAAGTTTINVTQTPTLSINSVTICAGQTATLTVIGATNYTWSPGNSNGSSYTIAPASNTVVSVIGANNSCTTQTTASVTIGTGISISVNSATICSGETATLTASGATSYTWNNAANTSNITDNPLTTTIYTVSGENGGCNGVNTATITVNSTPTLSINSSSICSGGTVNITVSGASTYTWSNGINGNTQTVNPNTTTTYSVIGTDNNNCSNQTSTTVTVITTPTITVNSATICSGQTATLNANGATTYTWSNASNNTSINVTPVITTTYSVIGENTNCFSSDISTVTVVASPTINASSSSSVGCLPFCVSFTENTSTTTTNINYNFGDGNTTSNSNPNYCYTVSGTYTVTVIATNTVLGCSSSYTLPITALNSAVADFNISPSNVVTSGTSVNYSNNSSNASSYIWADACLTNTTATTDYNNTYADTGSCCITLIAANVAGCNDTITKCITIIKDVVIVIPNVFTPNGDGKNDVFKITSNGLKSLNCVIYDRWGLKMYEWDGIKGFWDGNTKGGSAPDGTYFYIINYTDLLDKSTTEKGYLNLFQN
jgi:gliding motility-associated-like protein